MNAIERLLGRVERIERDTNGCRIWDGATDKDGYGVTTLREDGRRMAGVTARVHRHVLGNKVGRVLAPTELACHTCDVPSCVESTHLWVGTPLDNRRDAIAKGRVDLVAAGLRLRSGEQVRGDQHGRRKLHSTEVVVILQMLEEGELHRVIAERFMVNTATITNIATGKNWRSVQRPEGLHERRALVKQSQARDWHGTYSGYQYYRCRCAPCTAANTDRHRAWRESKRSITT